MLQPGTSSRIALVAAVFVLASAARQYPLVERWTDPDFNGRAYHKVLVLAITDDLEARKIFENLFVSHLRGANIRAVPSYSIVKDLGSVDEAGRQRILDTIEQQQIEGAISVRAVPLKELGESAWADGWRRALGSGITIRQLIEESLPTPKKSSGKYGIEAALWDADGWRRVWAARTNPYSRNQMENGASDFVQAVMYALQTGNLVLGTATHQH